MISRTPKDTSVVQIAQAATSIEASLDTFLENQKLGSELMDEVIKEPTLDRYLDRSPKVGNPIDYPGLVGVLHRKREMYITAEQKKKEPKSDE